MKKHLSRIVSFRLLLTIVSLFVVLLVSTAVFIYFYAKGNTKDIIDGSVDNLTAVVDNTTEKWFDSRLELDIRGFNDNGADYVQSTAINDFLNAVEFEEESERNIIDDSGKIIYSSNPKNKGFDMHSNPEAEKLLKKMKESSEMFVTDFIESPINGERMRFGCGALSKFGGFMIEGFTTEDFNDFRQNYSISQTRFESIGMQGYYLLTDKKGNVLSSTSGNHDGESISLPEDVEKLIEEKNIIKKEVFGVNSYIGVRAIGEDLVIAVYPMIEAWGQWIVSMILLVVIYVIAFVLLFLVTRQRIFLNVVKGVYSLNGSLKLITEGNLDERADFRESIEFDELSEGINMTVDRLKGLIQEAKERIDSELELAARIQLSFLPQGISPFPERDEFELYASMTPAKEVGGDFYDYFFVDEDHLALVMADVSGKGIPAAMFMAATKEKIHRCAMKNKNDVAKVIQEVNTDLISENDAGMFVTVWIGVMDLTTGHIDYVDAGHEYPAISRAGGEFTADEDVHSGPVAARKKMKFEAGAIELSPGDILYLYTDGVTEANNSAGEMFRRSRMLEALNSDREAAVQDIDNNVRNAVAEFVQDAPQFDDTTTLCLRYKGK